MCAADCCTTLAGFWVFVQFFVVVVAARARLNKQQRDWGGNKLINRAGGICFCVSFGVRPAERPDGRRFISCVSSVMDGKLNSMMMYASV